VYTVYIYIYLSLPGILFRFFVGFPSISEALYDRCKSLTDGSSRKSSKAASSHGGCGSEISERKATLKEGPKDDGHQQAVERDFTDNYCRIKLNV
jgi:hypothetical protein